jgi:hypothetical protein
MPITATVTAAKAAMRLMFCSVAQISAESAAKVISEITIITVPTAMVLLLNFNVSLPCQCLCQK